MRALLLLLLSQPAACFFPSRIEYCTLRCVHNNEVSSGCFCKAAPQRQEITEGIVEFRQAVLDVHNELRNRIARGEEQRENYPSATDMHVLNYDLELEYLARCYITSSRFVDGPDVCRATTYCTPYPPGQNLFGSPTKNTSLEFVREVVMGWYEEKENVAVEDRRKLIDKYRNDISNSSHFTQLVWSYVKRIGCVRAWLPQNKEQWRFVLACNYAGPKHLCAANIVGNAVYEAGKPCSRCRNSRKCSLGKGGFDALCGTLRPAPTMTPKMIGRGGRNVHIEGVIHRHIQKYMQDEYDDVVVPVFFDNGGAHRAGPAGALVAVALWLCDL